MFNNKSILVTGGTGSFGNAFIQYILDHYEPKKIIIYSRDELKQFNMQNKFKEFNCMRYFIGDVRDYPRLKLATREVDILVHAAALKHVPAAEYNPTECIRTNINGAENIIQACLANEIKKVVALSTDKAANPINLYGATKLVSDKLFISANNLVGDRDINFSVVRYGNVINSRGSIVPFFKKLIDDSAEYFPITDNRMTRFLITLNQSVEFVISCFKNMKGGEIFVPKLPSIYIKDLATAMDPQKEQRIIGIRPGEKIHEIMCPVDESMRTIEFSKHYLIMPTIDIKEKIENKEFFTSSLNEKGKIVAENFEYNSGNNSNFLSVDEISSFLKIS